MRGVSEAARGMPSADERGTRQCAGNPHAGPRSECEMSQRPEWARSGTQPPFDRVEVVMSDKAEAATPKGSLQSCRADASDNQSLAWSSPKDPFQGRLGRPRRIDCFAPYGPGSHSHPEIAKIQGWGRQWFALCRRGRWLVLVLLPE